MNDTELVVIKCEHDPSQYLICSPAAGPRLPDKVWVHAVLHCDGFDCLYGPTAAVIMKTAEPGEKIRFGITVEHKP